MPMRPPSPFRPHGARQRGSRGLDDNRMRPSAWRYTRHVFEIAERAYRNLAAMALALERIGWSSANHRMRLQAAQDLAQERLKQKAA